MAKKKWPRGLTIREAQEFLDIYGSSAKPLYREPKREPPPDAPP